MVKDNDLIGIIGLFRQQVRPFNDKQIELVTDFAAQAVIAIENARLLNELRQRTADLGQRTTDLTEALEQQTATSEVLQVISSFAGELDPVFQAMLEKAAGICDVTYGNIYRWDNGVFQLVATHNTPRAFVEARRRSPPRPNSKNLFGRIAATKTVLHIADFSAEQQEHFEAGNPDQLAAVELGGVKTILIVPLLRENELIGFFSLIRQQIKPFTDKQIELVTNFAAQAVIAIENARLLNELRQRTTDLTEALEQQTATSEVLKVISGSPSDLRPVFEAMLDNATRICQASLGTMTLYENGGFRHVALHGAPAAYEELRAREPVIVPKAAQGLGRLASTKQVVHIADSLSEPPEARGGLAQLAAARTLLIVPMLKEQELVGSFGIYRQEVRPFTDKQIALVKNFAAQAVIAIENARLLNELRQRTTDLSEALEQQTATSEVLQVISSSPGELDPVFAAMLASATHICEAKFGNLFLREGETFRAVAWHGEATYVKNWRQEPLTIKTDVPDIPLARLAATKQRVHIADLRQDVAYKAGFAPLVTLVDRGGARSLLIVPMLKERTLVGAIAIYRQEVRPFSEKQVQLLENFAAQAVIAIENARLLGELRERTEEVVKLNERLEQRVTDQVGEIERMGRLRRFLPPQVADLIVASGSEKQLESHRREITALFCDLRGFTGFSESSDPEDVMALLRDYHAAIGEIIIKYSGTLERYAGDGVMVVFNDPVPVDNPALQAVLMALEMRDAIGAMTDKWRRMGHDIGFGIGIAHGFATLGTIGFEGRFDYAAIGTVSNVASRLCDEAKPGQILISPRVLMEIEDAIAVEPVGEFTLKGIRRPLAAYNVLAARAGQEPQADSGVS
jgi:GAF domain-containing protein